MADHTAQAQIRLATPDDLPALVRLAARYYVGSLDESERSEGFLSILPTGQWFRGAIDAGGIHVADVGGDLVGFIAVTDPPDRSAAPEGSITRAMIDLAQEVHFDGIPIARQRFALRGPVLIDRSARGRGIYSAFNAAARTAYRDRYDVGVLFVSAENPRSLHTTTTKLGARRLAEFDVDGRTYHFLAFAF